jgi:hypothetical protein
MSGGLAGHMSSSPFWAYNRSKVITGGKPRRRLVVRDIKYVLLSGFVFVLQLVEDGEGDVGGGSDAVYVP